MSQSVKVHFLGTNGWFASDTGHTTCHLIDAPEAYIILDAGTGLYRADSYITEDKPIYLFLSHFHFDHIFGLHILNKFKFSNPVTIITQDRSEKILEHICNQPFTVGLKDLPIKYSVKEISEGRHEGFPFGLEARLLVHISRCFGYRFEFANKTITFTTDTGVCDNMKDLARDADLLIAECGLRPGESTPLWPHLNPTDSAGVAKECNVKKLALVHFDAAKYPYIEDRYKALEHARNIFKNTIVTEDKMSIELN